MRTYVNGDFLNKLPAELRKVIIDTKVISGYGRTSGETNFTSTDKIYLLSAHEVWENKVIYDGIELDTAYNQTRQLDYYKNLGVITSNNSNTIKRYKDLDSSTWWLRTANYYFTNIFLGVSFPDGWAYIRAFDTNGFTPAFRIG